MLVSLRHLISHCRHAQILLSVIVLAIWFPAIHPGTINIDTPWLVVDNPILSDPSATILWRIFSDFSLPTRLSLGAEYLPVRDLSVWLDHRLFGTDFRWHHAQSLLWYVLACCALLRILRLWFSPAIAFLLAAGFAVHPTHVENVVWLASRKDVLSLCISFWCLELLLKRKSMMLALSLALIAYWAKNTAIIIPAIGVLLQTACPKAHADSSANIGPKLSTAQWACWAICFAAALGISMKLGSEVGMFATRRGNTITEILAISATAWGESLMTFAWPVSLSVLYPEPTGATLIAIIGVLWTLCAIWFWAQHRQTQPLLALGLCWFVLAMLPFSQLTPLQNLKADRYLLIPGVGCFIVIGWLIHKHRAMAWLTFAWVLAMMVLTQQRIEVFTSSEKLWRDATVHAPLAPRNWNSLIGVLIDEHRLTEAEIVIHKAREIHPNHPLLLQSQGLIQIAHGDTDAAIESLSVAWSQRPALQRSGNNLALMLLRKGELDKAREVAQALTKRHPRYLKGWNTLCSIEIAAKNSTKAIAASEKALSISPKSATAWVNLGTGYYLQNDRPQAATAWKNALKIDPSLEYAQRGLRALENTENE